MIVSVSDSPNKLTIIVKQGVHVTSLIATYLPVPFLGCRSFFFFFFVLYKPKAVWRATAAFIEVNVFATLYCKTGHRTGKVGSMCIGSICESPFER